MDHLAVALKQWREAAEKMQADVGQAVALLNRAIEVASCAEGREAHAKRDVGLSAAKDYALRWHSLPETLPPQRADNDHWSQRVWLALPDGRVVDGEAHFAGPEAAHGFAVHAWFADRRMLDVDPVAWMPFAVPGHPRTLAPPIPAKAHRSDENETQHPALTLADQRAAAIREADQERSKGQTMTTTPELPRKLLDVGLWQRFQAWRERTGFFMDGRDGGM